MHTPYLTAFEHQTIPIGISRTGISLTPAEAEYLTYLGELRPGFCERRHGTVRLAQYCGVVSLGNRMLEVLPKTDEHSSPAECRGVLLRLLRAAEHFPIFRHLSAGHHLRTAPLLEVFISAFFDAVTEIVRGGLLRQYHEREDDLQVVRGRILAGRQFAIHANRPDQIACRFDDLTADNVWNRLIKAGLRAVRPWIRGVELNRRWVELMTVFDEVADVTIDSKTPNRLVFDRHAVRYRTAVDWVRWILALLSPSLRAGEDAAPGLLFDMNQLFQSAVAAGLQRRATVEPGTIVEVQDTSRYLTQVRGTDGRRAFRLKPDLVVRRHGSIVAIGDTKWKRLKVSKSGYMMPSEADVYQMLAYATAHRCEHLALIFPTHSGLSKARDTAFQLPSVGELRPTINIICLDVHSDSMLPSYSAVESPFFRLFSGEGSLQYER
jgi:5-methylcytosine-specific restriction enzyme subunit McrC